MDAMGAQSPRLNYSCWEKPLRPGAAIFDLGGGGAPVTPFPHFWEKGINSPNSALTLRADYQRQMTALHDDIGYTYTRIHAPFSREYSVSQGPPLPGAPANSSGTTSYFNAFATYDFLLSIGMKPWIELGYTPCWMVSVPWLGRLSRSACLPACLPAYLPASPALTPPLHHARAVWPSCRACQQLLAHGRLRYMRWLPT